MGSNMQRQAVPLLKTESPIVGTGMEYKAAVDSGVCVLCEGTTGSSPRVEANRGGCHGDDSGETDTYHLIKFLRSNQGTCINQRPIVSKGQRVKERRRDRRRSRHRQRRDLLWAKMSSSAL